MKKYLLSTITLLLFVFAVSVASTKAQSIYSVRIHVPFEFQVNNKMFPAGSYRILRPDVLQTSGYRALQLINLDDNSSIMLNSSSVDKRDESKHSGFIFNRYEDIYFLSEINFGSKKITLPRTHSEKDLIARYGELQTQVVIGF